MLRDQAIRHPFSSEQERARLAAVVERIDEAAGLTSPVPAPEYGAPQRDAIASLVDNHVQDVCSRIDELVKQLNAMKQQVLVGSAAAKQTLNEHIGVCLAVNQETDRISEVIDQLAQKVLRL